MAKPAKPDPKKLAVERKSAENNVKHAMRKLQMYDELIKQDKQATKQLIGKLESDVKKIKQIAETLSYGEWLMGLSKSLAKIGGGACKAMSAAGKEVRDAHREMLEGAGEIAMEDLKDDIKELAGQHEDDDNVIVSTLAKAVAVVDQWGSITWWAYTVLRKLQGGTWNDTFFGAIGVEFDRTTKDLKKEAGKRSKIFSDARKKTQKAMEKWVAVDRAIIKKIGAAKKAA